MKRNHGAGALRPVVLSWMAALVLGACGGGGTGSVPGSGAPGTVSGTVVKGPVAGATVTAHAVANGAPGAQLGSATTDAQGAFMMSIGDYSGPLMLQMRGGSYIDEATGASMAMASGDIMTAVMPVVAAGSTLTGVEVTPLTAMAQSMAAHMAGGLTPANITLANTAVGHYFMVGDILHTPPMNPLQPASGATQDMMNYGMTLAAMSQYAKGAGMASSSGFVTAMMNDASDGFLDGRAGGTQVAMMGAGMMGGTTGTMMQPDAGRAGLAAAMLDFMASGLNRSGVTATQMTSLMEQLHNLDGWMH